MLHSTLVFRGVWDVSKAEDEGIALLERCRCAEAAHQLINRHFCCREDDGRPGGGVAGWGRFAIKSGFAGGGCVGGPKPFHQTLACASEQCVCLAACPELLPSPHQTPKCQPPHTVDPKILTPQLAVPASYTASKGRFFNSQIAWIACSPVDAKLACCCVFTTSMLCA